MAFNLSWDDIGEKTYEVGCDRGVLYPVADDGTYPEGFAWNGLTGIDESPSGADSNKQFANNDVYANIRGTEEYAGSIKAYTYPREWNECDGHPEVVAGVAVGQQNRRAFALSYRTLKGNDTLGVEYGYIIHLVYGATCSPSSKSHGTMQDSVDLEEMSWDFDTVPIGITFTGAKLKKTATLDIDSTVVDATKLTEFEEIIYGEGQTKASLPLPSAVLAHFAA